MKHESYGTGSGTVAPPRMYDEATDIEQNKGPQILNEAN
jgi:hypothetical protein